MAYRSARLASILAGTAALAGISAGLAAEVGAPHKTDAHANWKLIEENCFKCHNTDDWAGSVAFDTMTVDSITDEGKVWEATIKKVVASEAYKAEYAKESLVPVVMGRTEARAFTQRFAAEVTTNLKELGVIK